MYKHLKWYCVFGLKWERPKWTRGRDSTSAFKKENSPQKKKKRATIELVSCKDMCPYSVIFSAFLGASAVMQPPDSPHR
ncbi:hypothetical protein E2C01_083782 [Portunus trituberculatus]|uniref:Uncharacterized protein n=1 Tax=Portunus trituberculatus TaxID=210409 RepID=A0A5B7IW31_PORTR|nr:hypothetical protein [Portunus trituberculatus]